MPNPIAVALCTLAACALAAPVAAQSGAELRIRPAAPKALQPVSVEVRTPGVCGIEATTRMEGNVIKVGYRPTCFISPPPPPQAFEISLGNLPAGEYQVALDGSGAPPTPFTVRADGDPPRDRPFVQTGLWWDPRFPGTGITIVDAYPARRIVSFATHDATRSPVVYTLVLERDQVEGTLYRSSATPPALAPAAPDVALVAAGSARLLPDPDGTLVFDYRVDALPPHRLLLQRFPL